jgi:hypothetical protein
MNFKSFTLKAAIAATVLAGSTLAVSPAEAAGLKGSLAFTGEAVATPTDIEFYLLNGQADPANGRDIGRFRVSVASTTGDFDPLDGTRGTIKDLTGIISATATNPPAFQAINNFLSFGQNDPFNFTLTAFKFVNARFYKFEGFFTDGTIGRGELTTQAGLGGVDTYSASLIATGEEIPTPALLPGLIGMGAAVLRKRKAEATEQAEAEA